MKQSVYERVLAVHQWRPIRGCPGRSVLAQGVVDRSVSGIAGFEVEVTEATFPGARDRVAYCFFEGGGLISYKKPNGFLHTLCDEAAMERKLRMLRGGSSPDDSTS